MDTIVLIEDQIELAQLIIAFLNKKGFSLCHFTEAKTALHWIETHETTLILLDIMLPDMDGFAFMKQLRHQYDIPVIIISARSEKADQLLGFELGVDDYIPKPVDPDILCAKIHAVKARTAHITHQNQIISNDIKIDIAAHIAYLKDQRLDLNAKEFELLSLFVKNEGRILQKEYLFNEIWGMDSESENQTLTVHVKMLRSKIEEDPKKPKRIITVWGVGYRYEKV